MEKMGFYERLLQNLITYIQFIHMITSSTWIHVPVNFSGEEKRRLSMAFEAGRLGSHFKLKQYHAKTTLGSLNLIYANSFSLSLVHVHIPANESRNASF